MGEFRLEDVLQFMGYEVRPGSDYAIKPKDAKNKPSHLKAALAKLYPQPKYDSHVTKSLAIVDESVINYEMMAKLLEYITENN